MCWLRGELSRRPRVEASFRHSWIRDGSDTIKIRFLAPPVSQLRSLTVGSLPSCGRNGCRSSWLVFLESRPAGKSQPQHSQRKALCISCPSLNHFGQRNEMPRGRKAQVASQPWSQGKESRGKGGGKPFTASQVEENKPWPPRSHLKGREPLLSRPLAPSVPGLTGLLRLPSRGCSAEGGGSWLWAQSSFTPARKG